MHERQNPFRTGKKTCDSKICGQKILNGKHRGSREVIKRDHEHKPRFWTHEKGEYGGTWMQATRVEQKNWKKSALKP